MQWTGVHLGIQPTRITLHLEFDEVLPIEHTIFPALDVDRHLLLSAEDHQMCGIHHAQRETSISEGGGIDAHQSVGVYIEAPVAAAMIDPFVAMHHLRQRDEGLQTEQQEQNVPDHQDGFLNRSNFSEKTLE